MADGGPECVLACDGTPPEGPRVRFTWGYACPPDAEGGAQGRAVRAAALHAARSLLPLLAGGWTFYGFEAWLRVPGGPSRLMGAWDAVFRECCEEVRSKG